MNKKNKILLIVIISVLVLVTLLTSIAIPFVLRNIVLSPSMYTNTWQISLSENKAIKKAALGAIKNVFMDDEKSADVFMLDENNIELPELEKSSYIKIDKNFMNTLKKESDGQYSLTVKMKHPKEYYCHIYIKETDGQYKVTAFMLDV